MMFRARTLAVALLLVSALVIAATPPRPAVAGERWVPRTLTTGAYDQYALDISGSRIAWVEATTVADPYRTGGRIMTWRAGDAAPISLSGTAPATFGDAPCVSGDRVAWTGARAWLFEPSRHIEASVYVWTRSAGRSVVATGAVCDADIDGGHVVWRDETNSTSLGPHSFAILAWRPGGLPHSLGGAHAGPPAVSSARAAWWDGDYLSGGVYTCTEGGAGPSRVATTPPVIEGGWGNYQIPVRVSGDRIAWKVDGETGDDVYTWTPGSGTVRVTHDGGAKSVPDLSGDRIVWSAESGGRSAVWTWTPATGAVRLRNASAESVSPRVSGDRIVWSAGLAGSRQVYTWTPRTRIPVRVSDGRGDDVDPVVSGSRIAWRSARPGEPYRIVTAMPTRTRSRATAR